MSITDRDRKILLLLVPALILAAYWFLLLSPKRDEAATAAEEQTVQEQRRDDAEARLAALSGARTDFAADYAELVRLGKAVPASVDMPTILVQLEDAARGTDITFTRIATTEREPAADASATPAPGSDQSGSTPASAGGEPAQSGPGTAAESAGNAVAGANASSAAAAEQSGVSPADTQTSQTARQGALPVGGGAATPGTAGAATSGVAGLDSVGLELEFTGNFLDLSDFFHRIKRYVALDGDRLDVRGRLVTVEGVEFASEPDLFPRIKATLTATAYLAPAIEGATAGATPAGPATTTPASTEDGQTAPLAAADPTAAPLR